MLELARGLVDSEYWELVRLILVNDLELAKSALEDTRLSESELRVHQGEAKALTSAHNFIVDLAREEVSDGREKQ